MEPLYIIWDTEKLKGDTKRLMDMSGVNTFGFELKASIEKGIKKTFNWHLENNNQLANRCNTYH